MRSSRTRSRAAVVRAIAGVVGLVWLTCAAAGCGDEPAATIDAVTSASPRVAEAELVEGVHPGWGLADCESCHGDVHESGYRPPDCAGCHGKNGAPWLLDGHGTEDCDSCHADRHPTLDLAAPGDCRACHRFAPSDGCAHVESTDVVVIGAGGGGLSAAATAAMGGLKVVVLERQAKVGGMMTRFHRGPYNIEVSLHGFDGLDEAGLNAGLFEGLDIADRVRPVRIDPLYRVVFPDLALDVPGDVEAYRALLKARFPAESDGIDALVDEMIRLGGVLVAAMEFFETGVMPEGLTVDDLYELQGMMEITLQEYIDRFVRDPQLVAAFTILSGFTGNLPTDLSAMLFLALWNSYHLGGYFYFEGGSQALADAMAAVIVEHGGEIELNTTATKIVVEDGRATQVRAQDGRCFDARYVVSNAPAPLTVFDLVGREHFSEAYTRRVEAMEPGQSSFVVYLGVDHDYRSAFGLTHEIFVGTDYDPAAALEAVESCDIEEVGMAITNYSLVDPTASPEGRNVITITTILPYECRDEWAWDVSHEAYRQQKDEVAAVLIERAEAFLPDLSSHIEVQEVGTPRTIEAFTLSPRGSIIGWSNTMDQSLANRLEQTTEIENLFLAGAWTYPGGGQSQVMLSGQIAAGYILDSEAEDQR
jgi:all-trans-retinol 13,14-reductase